MRPCGDPMFQRRYGKLWRNAISKGPKHMELKKSHERIIARSGAEADQDKKRLRNKIGKEVLPSARQEDDLRARREMTKGQYLDVLG
jgi:hypothetical protein